jgi:low affinity Fe/Cu permease
MTSLNEKFRLIAQRAAHASGTATAFLAAFLVVFVWAVTGPFFGFSDTWQLVINTSTTIVTFLMVFLIQNSQNRDSQALHAKLDELIIKLQAADNRLVVAEDLPDDELADIMTRQKERAVDAAEAVQEGRNEDETKQAQTTGASL